MKNRLCLFILIALCFVTVLTSAASAKDYTVSDTDLTISIDDSYWYVFTRDNIEGNPELDELGITYEYIYDIMMEKDIYIDALVAYDDGSILELCVVKKKSGGAVNLSNYDDEDVMKFAAEFVEKLDVTDVEYSIFKTDYTYIKMEYYEEGSYFCDYITIVNGEAYDFSFNMLIPFSSQDKEEINKIIKSAKFEVDPNMKEKSSAGSRVLYNTIRGGIIGGISGGVAAFVISRKKKKEKKEAEEMERLRFEASLNAQPPSEENKEEQ